MAPEQAQHELRARVDRLDSPVTESLIDAMIAFYRDQRIDSVDLDADGDMLLFQWGTYDWGEGKNFELDVARQFIDREKDEPKQLHILMKFPPSETTKALGDGNEWCEAPKHVDAFVRFIRSCNAYLALQSQPPASVEIDFEEC